jgi:hypothetical protein
VSVFLNDRTPNRAIPKACTFSNSPDLRLVRRTYPLIGRTFSARLSPGPVVVPSPGPAQPTAPVMIAGPLRRASQPGVPATHHSLLVWACGGAAGQHRPLIFRMRRLASNGHLLARFHPKSPASREPPKRPMPRLCPADQGNCPAMKGKESGEEGSGCRGWTGLRPLRPAMKGKRQRDCWRKAPPTDRLACDNRASHKLEAGATIQKIMARQTLALAEPAGRPG